MRGERAKDPSFIADIMLGGRSAQASSEETQGNVGDPDWIRTNGLQIRNLFPGFFQVLAAPT